ncbi:WG repeat-containing protein [Aequorivita lipolytica]|uniref:WG repeat-containing protein n=1 Tax=Aequorivita lipolytica TaxID=153267 RepID=UPI001356B715|nr:WG repeat-containing protein [Aequorivita lipolytica]
MIKFYDGEFDEIGVPSGYLNSKGDTIVPIGKYYYCYTDTIRNFGMIVEKETGKILGIDQNANELFEVYKYDNGPDYTRDGLFRIIQNGKFGFANENGEIVIQPKYKCARPFDNEIAMVTDFCEIKPMENREIWIGDKWFKIDTQGNKIMK